MYYEYNHILKNCKSLCSIEFKLFENTGSSIVVISLKLSQENTICVINININY